MAAKHKHKRRHPPALSTDALEARAKAALSEGRTQHALELAKQLHKQEPTPAHRDLLRTAYLERARDLRRRGYTRDAATVLDNAVQLAAGDPAWLARLAGELAAAGDVRRSLGLIEHIADPAQRAQVLNRAADAAVEQGRNGRGLLPESLQTQFDLVLRAFAQAEAGDDDAAREALQGIGLQSPFLEWKVLLRGLLAYYQGDDARALENWQRLDPERLPARLAAPLRFPIDPAFRQAQPPETQALLRNQADRLQGSGLVQPLRHLQAALADTEHLTPAFRQAESLTPALQQLDPGFVAKLAVGFYWAIVHYGQPNDLPRYERLFGKPPEDPNFDRLQALVHEHMGLWAQAHRYWQNFEKWLAGNPAAWRISAPGDAQGNADRVRAFVWCHMGRNAARIPDMDRIPNLPPILRDHPERPRRLVPGAEHCFGKSLELAPDALEAHEALLHHYEFDKQPDKAEQAARRLLEHFPNHVPTLEALGDLLLKGSGYPDALGFFQRALQADPLNRRLRDRLAVAHLALARAHAEDGLFDQARDEYQAALALDEKDLASALCKWAACEFKAGAPERAEELIGRARAAEGNPSAIAYNMLIEAIRLKLPRRLKTRFDREFAAVLAGPPTAAAAVGLVQTAGVHHIAEVTYTGRQTHEKKVLAYLQKVSPAEFTEGQLKTVGTSLLQMESLKPARDFAALGQRRFHGNPFFYWFEAESYFMQGPAKCPVWKAQPLLDLAAELAAKLPPDEEQKALLETIRQRRQMVELIGPGGMGMLQNLFGGLFAGDHGDEDEWYDDDEWDDEDEDQFIDPFVPPPRKKKGRKSR